jgi:DNA-binding TFAR19-related protein (PDSD5 family)
MKMEYNENDLKWIMENIYRNNRKKYKIKIEKLLKNFSHKK